MEAFKPKPPTIEEYYRALEVVQLAGEFARAVTHRGMQRSQSHFERLCGKLAEFRSGLPATPEDAKVNDPVFWRMLDIEQSLKAQPDAALEHDPVSTVPAAVDAPDSAERVGVTTIREWTATNLRELEKPLIVGEGGEPLVIVVPYRFPYRFALSGVWNWRGREEAEPVKE